MRAYISISISDGINKTRKGILCDKEEFPMVFEDRLKALEYWKGVKPSIETDPTSIRVRGSAQLIPDEYTDPNTYVDDLLYKENLEIIQ